MVRDFSIYLLNLKQVEHSRVDADGFHLLVEKKLSGKENVEFTDSMDDNNNKKKRL